MNATELSPQSYERLERWFEENSNAYPEGVEDFGLADHGAYIILSDPLDTGRFESLLEDSEEYEPENVGEEGVSALKIEEFGDSGLCNRYSIGVVFYPSEEVPLGAADPLNDQLEPTDDTVRETLSLLKLYLDQ